MRAGLAAGIDGHDVRLNEVNEIEAWDAAKRDRPELTWEEFEQAWTRFQDQKALRRTQLKQH